MLWVMLLPHEVISQHQHSLQTIYPSSVMGPLLSAPEIMEQGIEIIKDDVITH